MITFLNAHDAMKKLTWLCVAVAVLVGKPALCALAADAATRPESSQSESAQPAAAASSISWDDGIKLQCQSEWLSLRFGGKVMGDVGWADGEGQGASGADVGQESEWRRLRPYLSGTVADRLDFKIEAEFAGLQTQWMDLYLRIKNMPVVGDATVGHFKEPFGLEELTSSADTTFLERALPDAFTPGRSLGAMLQQSVLTERATWALGVFRSLGDQPSFPDGRGGEALAVTGRVTWLPWRDEKTDELVHLGAAYSFRSLLDDARYRQRPEAHFVGNLTDTGSFRADATHLVGSEAAWARGPLSLQGEYMAAFADQPDADVAFLHGAYVQASYFLTGEHRPYDSGIGVFKGPQPLRPFPTEGLGAWELAARYSFLDLRGPSLADTARQVQDFTVGLNWYLSPNLRLGWNYARSWIDGSGSSGAADIFLFRVQLAF